MHAICPTHLILFYVIALVVFSEEFEIVKLLITPVHLSPTFC